MHANRQPGRHACNRCVYLATCYCSFFCPSQADPERTTASGVTASPTQPTAPPAPPSLMAWMALPQAQSHTPAPADPADAAAAPAHASQPHLQPQPPAAAAAPPPATAARWMIDYAELQDLELVGVGAFSQVRRPALHTYTVGCWQPPAVLPELRSATSFTNSLRGSAPLQQNHALLLPCRCSAPAGAILQWRSRC